MKTLGQAQTTEEAPRGEARGPEQEVPESQGKSPYPRWELLLNKKELLKQEAQGDESTGGCERLHC